MELRRCTFGLGPFLVAFTVILSAYSGTAQLSRTVTRNLEWDYQWRPGPEAAIEKAFSKASNSTAAMGVPQDCFQFPSAQSLAEVELSGVELRPWKGDAGFLEDRIASQPQPEVTVGYGQAENIEGRLHVCVTPFVKRGGRWFRVTSYQASVISREVSPTKQNLDKGGGRVANSVLQGGGWHRIALESTGMYKITPAYLKENDIAQREVGIDELRIVGNGEGMLPERAGDPRPQGLKDAALQVEDINGDGIFNDNDYLLFYGRSPHEWEFQAGTNQFKHSINTYREKNFYFLSVNNGPGYQPNPQPGPGNPSFQVNSFDDYDYVEDEESNLVGTGRQWFGDRFEFTLSYNYDFNFPFVVTSEAARLSVDVVGRVTTGNTAITTSYRNQRVATNTIDPLSTTGQYPNYVQRKRTSNNFNPQGPNITLNLSYDNSANPSGVAWLDDLEIQVRRELRMSDEALHFRDARSIDSGRVAQFNIAAATAELQVWDVTEPTAIRAIQGNFTNGIYSFTADASSLKDYVAFRGSSFPAPDYVEEVSAQNLRGMEVPEYLIVAHSKFLGAAEDLAEFHRKHDQLEVAVVAVQEIFNEYSSGGQDITAIRDFAKDLYERGGKSKLKYLLLFGDGSYDYKDRITNNDNYVPVWTEKSSFSLNNSDITDDYFGYLDDGEGANLASSLLDLGVGRIPCRSAADANAYVRKVKNYAGGPERFGEWRNNILLMTDDEDKGWERIYFVPKSENLESRALNFSKAFNIQKIYTGSYQQVTSSGGERYPEASRDMFRTIQQGTLIANYIGHGGEIGLSSEKLLDLGHVNSWTNFDALALFITITCEFSRFDDPNRVSAGEQLLLNRQGGAIALLSTTRVVFVRPATNLNMSVFDTVLARPDGLPQRLGDIVKGAKNDPQYRTEGVKTKFSLLGDPALRLAIPRETARLTAVNEDELRGATPPDLSDEGPGKRAGGDDPQIGILQVSSCCDTLQALDQVSLRGQVESRDGQRLEDFNGILRLSIYDKPRQRQTLDNDNIGGPVSFKVRNNILYRGKVAVENGLFQAEFRVPLDIDYSFGQGKVSFYVSDAESEIDGAGAFDKITVGGFNEDAPSDDRGPEIELFMNDESFVSGGITGPNPTIYARLSDSSGINTVGNGIGHDLKAILDGRSDEPYILNEYYEANLDSYQAGELRFPLFDLEEGEHTLRFKAFDTYNNPAEATTRFIVAENEELVLRRLLNYPNPFTTYTEFQFEHNRANQPLDVQVQIFTVAGQLVKTINTSVLASGNRVTGIAWNGLDDYGDKIGKGVYVYRVTVRSQVDNSTAEKYEKLVILR